MRSLFIAGFLASALVSQPVQAKEVVSGSCSDAREPRLVVNLTGFKSKEGIVRVQIYGPEPDEFLKSGAWLQRVEVPVAPTTYTQVCFELPPGQFAVAARHDANDNGKSDWNDGGGFSRNPDLSLFRLKPKHEDVVVTVGPGTTNLAIVMNYRRGLSIGPL